MKKYKIINRVEISKAASAKKIAIPGRSSCRPRCTSLFVEVGFLLLLTVLSDILLFSKLLVLYYINDSYTEFVTLETAFSGCNNGADDKKEGF